MVDVYDFPFAQLFDENSIVHVNNLIAYEKSVRDRMNALVVEYRETFPAKRVPPPPFRLAVMVQPRGDCRLRWRLAGKSNPSSIVISSDASQKLLANVPDEVKSTITLFAKKSEELNKVESIVWHIIKTINDLPNK